MSINSEVARKHHYVPKFLLRPWAAEGELSGYFWDDYKQKVSCKKLGVKGFCYEIDLLAFDTPRVRSDALETDFFAEVDDRAAKVVEKLIDVGTKSLDADERSDLGRLILSLDSRRPPSVDVIRNDGAKQLKDTLDFDREILDALEAQDIDGKPSEIWSKLTNASLEDHALALLQRITDNPKVGEVLINSHWRICPLGVGDGSLVLSDRPLIRTKGYDDPEAIWALPLAPKVAFVACNSLHVVRKLDRLTPLQLRKRINESSLNQFEKYVFMVDETNMPLVSKRLRPSG